MHIEELPTIPEQVARFYFSILGIGIRMQVARGVDLFSVRQFGSSLRSWFIVATVPRVVPITVLPIVSPVVVPIILSIRVTCGHQVVVIVTAVLPSLIPIPSTTRIILRLVILFVVAALPWFSDIVFTIGPAVGDFH
jgi:hypothetical protein